MSRPCVDLEIGADVAGLLNLRYRGVPDPTSWTFSPYSRVEVGGDGRSRGFGFPTASWAWEVLSQIQLDVFLDFFAANTDASVVVNIYTYTDVGPGLSAMRERYEAVMHRPLDQSGKTLVSDSRTPIYNDVTVNFTHLVVV